MISTQVFLPSSLRLCILAACFPFVSVRYVSRKQKDTVHQSWPITLTVRQRNRRGQTYQTSLMGPLAQRTACNTDEDAEVCLSTETHTQKLLRVYKSSMCVRWYECDQRMRLSAGGVSRVNACKVCECV